MEKFDTVHSGYDKKQVNAFIDSIIDRVEEMVKEISLKDQAIKEYKKIIKNNEEKIKEMSSKLVKEQSGDSKILEDAKKKSMEIIKDAEMQADLIISECLMEAKKSEIKLNYLNSEIERLKQMKETIYYN
jgi:cell division septum initiation protein DivIVA